MRARDVDDDSYGVSMLGCALTPLSINGQGRSRSLQGSSKRTQKSGAFSAMARRFSYGLYCPLMDKCCQVTPRKKAKDVAAVFEGQCVTLQASRAVH